MPDVLVIGAGLGGLLCGRILRQKGCSVTILEAGESAGGLLRGFQWEGVHCDCGFHSVGGLGPGEPLERIFRPLGLMDLPWYRADADEGFPFLRLNADSPFERSHVLAPYSRSVWRLKGGGEALSDALAQGLDIRYGKRVVSIENQVVTCEDSSAFKADIVVSDLPPIKTLELVKDHVRPSYGHRLKSLQYGPDIFSVHCKLQPGCVPWKSASFFLDGNLMLHFGEPETHILELLCFGEGNPEAMIARAAAFFPGLKVQKYHTMSSPGYGPVKERTAHCISPITPIPWLFLTGMQIGLHGVLGTSVSALNTCKSINL